MKSPEKRWPWLRVDRVLGEWGVQQDNVAGRRHLEQGMEHGRKLEMSRENSDWKKLRRGWCWGPKGFREELLEWIGEKRGQQHYGEQKAERLVGELLRKAGWTQGELKRRRKGDLKEARMAARLRQETTMTWTWISRRLEMGPWRTAANAVRVNSKE